MLCRAQPTLSALARVTVHKRPDGTFTAVDLRDGCFGTATIMRIVAMFVPHNIFEDRAPDGARISRRVGADLQSDAASIRSRAGC